MGLTRRRLRVTAREAEWIRDWADAELVERVEAIEAQVEILDAEREQHEAGVAKRVEAIEAQVEILDAEREQLEREVATRVEAIEAQVEILDAERTELETELDEHVDLIETQVEILDAEREQLETALSVRPVQAPRTVRLPQAEEAAPVAPVSAARIDWRKLARFLVFVLVPWFVIGALVYAGWLLAS
jgi:hypothetical protein